MMAGPIYANGAAPIQVYYISATSSGVLTTLPRCGGACNCLDHAPMRYAREVAEVTRDRERLRRDLDGLKLHLRSPLRFMPPELRTASADFVTRLRARRAVAAPVPWPMVLRAFTCQRERHGRRAFAS